MLGFSANAQPAAGGGDFISRPTNNFEKVANAFEI